MFQWTKMLPLGCAEVDDVIQHPAGLSRQIQNLDNWAIRTLASVKDDLKAAKKQRQDWSHNTVNCFNVRQCSCFDLP